MKTLQECMEQVAKNHSWLSWDELVKHHGQFSGEFLISEMSGYYNEAAELYARAKWEEAVELNRRFMLASMPVGTELKAWDFVIWSKNHFESSKPEFKP